MPGPCMLHGQEEGNAAREDRSDSKALPGAGLFASFIRLPLRFSSSYLHVRLFECLFFLRSSVGGGYWNRGNIIYRNAGKKRHTRSAEIAFLWRSGLSIDVCLIVWPLMDTG